MIKTLWDALPTFYFIFQRLRRVENRTEVAKKLKEALRDRRMSPPEWSSLGKALGVFKE